MSTDFFTQIRPYMPCILVLLLGVIVGILYLHYGWRVSEKAAKMLESSKIKNLLWVLGGAFVAFAADFKAIDPNADKATLFYIYGGSALLTFLIGWIGWACWIAIKTTWMKLRNPARYPDQPFHPVGSFLWGSFEDYEKKFRLGVSDKNKATTDQYEEWTNRFLPLYSGNLAICLKTAQIRLAGQKLHLNEVSSILTALCAVLKSVYEDKGREIHARFLRAYRAHDHLPPGVLQHIRFARADHSSYAYFLVLEAANLDARPESITLPVEPHQTADRSLPGAPLAFATGEDQLDDNVDKTEYPQGLEPEMENQVRAYFKERSIRSLSCFLLKSSTDDRPFGVLTIESSHNRNMGDTHEQQSELKGLLRPFLVALEIATAP